VKQKWTDERTVAVRNWRQEYHTLEGYRWSRMALYLDFGRHAPEWLPDEQIDEIIREAWERNPPPFKQDW
jgi:hypothetical protein